MPISFFEIQNQAATDYPYLLFDKENLVCRSHFHKDIEIVEVVSGEILIIRDGQKLLLCAGEIGVIMPEEIHSYVTTVHSRVHVVKLSCRHSVEKEDLSLCRIPVTIDLSSPLGGKLHRAIGEIRREHERRDRGYGFAVSAQAAALLRDLLRSELCIKRAEADQKKHLTSMSAVETVNDYIRAHYTEPISLERISTVCGLSVYYFSHLFKESTGTTFLSYLTAYRCDKAAELLRSEKARMIDVALCCGFSDVCAFNRAFRRVFGQAPSEYRKQLK